MKTQNITWILLIAFIVLLFILPMKFIENDYGSTILTISTFFFGIFAGFCIAVTTTDYNSVRSLAAEETGGWIALLNTVRVYDAHAAIDLQKIISFYLQRSFDYDFVDYVRKTKKEFQVAQEFINSLSLNVERSSIHQNILGLIAGLVTTRQKLTVLGTKSLSSLEWTVLWTFAAMMIMTLYGLRTGDLFFDVVTVAVSTATILVLLLIRDIDRYIWNQATFSFEAYNNAFVAMGELSYYPAEFVDQGIVVPLENEYRIGTLLDPGKSWDRKIVVIKK